MFYVKPLYRRLWRNSCRRPYVGTQFGTYNTAPPRQFSRCHPYQTPFFFGTYNKALPGQFSRCHPGQNLKKSVFEILKKINQQKKKKIKHLKKRVEILICHLYPHPSQAQLELLVVDAMIMICVQLYQNVFRVQPQLVEPVFDSPEEPPHRAAEGFEQAALLHKF